MKARRLLGLVFILVAVTAAVVVVRTLALRSRQLVVPAVVPVAVDADRASARLAAAVRFKTIASLNDADAHAAEFEAFQSHLQSSFPLLHKVLQRERVGRFGLLYTWRGRDAEAMPIALMAHQDVVPVAPDTEREWQEPPFDGVVKDGFVWGRGSWDDKGNLMAILEAVEMRLAAGFVPKQTIYLIFGADEELGGYHGAELIAHRLAERHVHLQFVLDEGLVIVDGAFAGLHAPVAFVGVAEKGYLSVHLSAHTTPSHSSMPPPEPQQSAIGMLSAALVRLEDHPMPASNRGLSQAMFDTLAPEMAGFSRIVLANRWLFAPLIDVQLKKAASTNAALRTTTALTVVRGGDADNVLPGRADATVNFRLLPGDSSDDVMRHVARTVANPAIRIEKVAGFSEGSKVASTTAPGYALINRTLRELQPAVVVAPALMLAATDSRHFDFVADNVYKFSPVRARPDDLKRFHGINERMAIANYAELIQFYHQLIGNASTASSSQASP